MQPHSERCAPVGNFAVIVVGASVGGIGALRKLAAGLRREIPAALLVVQHIGRCASEMPQLLGRAGPLPAAHAVQGEPIRPGWIYVAPPDHHLVPHAGADYRVRLAGNTELLMRLADELMLETERTPSGLERRAMS